MENSAATPAITSFVIRFIHSAEANAQSPESAPYRGSIVHVQTNEEYIFARWEDAVDFIRRFVPLEPPSAGQEGGEPPLTKLPPV